MCIRDSQQPAARLRIDDRGFRHFAFDALRSCIAADERLWICLLYTSDAADERSSVDLGGRRIIKKKKTTHRHGY